MFTAKRFCFSGSMLSCFSDVRLLYVSLPAMGANLKYEHVCSKVLGIACTGSAHG